MALLELRSAEGLRSVRIILPHRHCDERGFFSEIWREDALREAGITAAFVQENHALSRAIGTLRGLHFQIGAAVQAKLVRCTRGSIFDVAVDIRRGSPTFRHHVAVILSAENWKQLYIPCGFAHGYCTLEPETEVLYKVTTYFDPAAERGLAWDDPEIAIAWPLDRQTVIMSDKDRGFPRLGELSPYFSYKDFPD